MYFVNVYQRGDGAQFYSKPTDFFMLSVITDGDRRALARQGLKPAYAITVTLKE